MPLVSKTAAQDSRPGRIVRPGVENLIQTSARVFAGVKTSLPSVLGVLMLTFGLLKCVNPTIDGWFHVQIERSGLPNSAILMGKVSEIVTGILFLLSLVRRWPVEWRRRILLTACSSLALVMLVAVYVHLQPRVPREVLPLGIKPPLIPLFVLCLDVLACVPAWKGGHANGERG